METSVEAGFDKFIEMVKEGKSSVSKTIYLEWIWMHLDFIHPSLAQELNELFQA